MPIKIPYDLPAVQTLTEENIFVMTEQRAIIQDIRPLEILLLNLMPTKIKTETQLSRVLGNSPLQVNLTLMNMKSHDSKNTPISHLKIFYKQFSQIQNNKYDGMIITGAPLEFMEYDKVDYWDELCEIMEWTKTHVHSTLHLCWGAFAALYYHFGIPKHILPQKISGIYPHQIEYKNSTLLRGVDDIFMVPQSRNITLHRGDIDKINELKILASSAEAGIYVVMTRDGKQVFITGHPEYDSDTLDLEYKRDATAGINPHIPVNYYPEDNPNLLPKMTWRANAYLLYSNWLNYFVYQSTPYEIDMIMSEKADINYSL